MNFVLRPASLPADYAAMAELLSAVQILPISADDLRENDALLPPGSVNFRLIAADESGRLIGLAHAYRYPNTVAGKLYVKVAAEPAVRRQGVGGALFEQVHRFAAEQGATRLVADVRDDDPESLAFARKRGYEIERHGCDAVLELASFDRAAFAGTLDAVKAQGITFTTLADELSEEHKRALYELYGRTMVDIPGYEAKSFMAYETWHRFAVEWAGARPDWIFIAKAGDRYVGVTQVIDKGDHLYTNHTLVEREQRGKGIALALKLLSVEAALQHGVAQMRTGNDSLNGPMLAVNRKLGYKPLPGDYTVAWKPAWYSNEPPQS